MEKAEFAEGVDALRGKKIVIIGCGAQGLNQGLNLRDSGLDVAYALRAEAIAEKRASFQRATDNGFQVGNYEDLIPGADVVMNMTPDKQHTAVVNAVRPVMKEGACLDYPTRALALSPDSDNSPVSRLYIISTMFGSSISFLNLTGDM